MLLQRGGPSAYREGLKRDHTGALQYEHGIAQMDWGCTGRNGLRIRELWAKSPGVLKKTFFAVPST